MGLTADLILPEEARYAARMLVGALKQRSSRLDTLGAVYPEHTGSENDAFFLIARLSQGEVVDGRIELYRPTVLEGAGTGDRMEIVLSLDPEVFSPAELQEFEAVIRGFDLNRTLKIYKKGASR